MPNQPNKNEIGGKTGETRADNHIAHVLGAQEAMQSLREEMRKLGLGTDAVSAKQGEIVESERRRLDGIRTLHLSLATLAEEVIDALGIHTSIQGAKDNLQTLRGEFRKKQEAIQQLQQQAGEGGALAQQIQTLEAETKHLEVRMQECQREIAEKMAKLEQLTQAIEGVERKIETALGVVLAPERVGEVMKEVRQFISSPDAERAKNLLQKLRDAASQNRSPAIQQAILMAETAQNAYAQGQSAFGTSALEAEKNQKGGELGQKKQELVTARRNEEEAGRAVKELPIAQTAQQALEEEIRATEGELGAQEKELQLQRGALRGAVGYFLPNALQERLVQATAAAKPENVGAYIVAILQILRDAKISEGTVVTMKVIKEVSFTMPKDNGDIAEKAAVSAEVQRQLEQSEPKNRTPHAEAFHPADMRDYVTLTQRENPSLAAVWVGVKNDGSSQEWQVKKPEDTQQIPFTQLRYIYRKR